jgi:hypothetical protein
MPLALSTGEAILLITLVTLPIAALAFALGARNALHQIGKGQFGIDRHPMRASGDAPVPRAIRDAEVRQMLEAKAYRQRSRGEPAIDVEAELARLLDEGQPRDLHRDPQLVAEVRQLVIATNERRRRQGREPLDVAAEVDRRLRELAE